MIKHLKLKDFRNYGSLDLELGSRLNLFIGSNGQGKSNLLEAIFFTAMLRSFRTTQVRDIRKIGGKGFYIGMDVFNGKWDRKLEVEYYQIRKLKIDQNPVFKASEFIRELRTVAFSPDDINIVTGNSTFRRRFIDILISIMVPGYMTALHTYMTALKSRNAVLKTHSNNSAMISAYEPMMAESAFFIIQQRDYYLKALTNEMNSLLSGFYDGKAVFEIKYRTDVPVDISAITEKFDSDRKKDMLRGFTGFGPQLDELELLLNGKTMRNYASTGQCRLISLCLKMAEVNILASDSSSSKDNIVVLVDDVTGELDENTRNSFFKVSNKAGQAFFTFTGKPDDDYFKDSRIYSINNGHIS